MKKPEHKPSGNSIARLVFVGISLVFQIGWILVRVQWLNEYSQWISAVTGLLAVAVVLKLNSKNTNSAMKMPWIMLILAVPVLGLSLYLLIEILGDPGVGKRMRTVRESMAGKMPAHAQQAMDHLHHSQSLPLLIECAKEKCL